MKVAVTGASGHIGSNLVRELISKGHQVRVLYHEDNRGFEGLPVEAIPGSMNDQDALTRLVTGTDIVFHLAAQISINGKNDKRLLDKNIEGTRNIIEAIHRSGNIRLIHFSSIHALEHEPLDQVMDEHRPLALTDPIYYTQSKAYSEQIVLEAVTNGLDAVILNPTAVIGPFDFKPSLMGQAIVRFYKGRLPALIPGGYDWVDVRDVVQAAINATTKGKAGKRYILSGQWKTIKTLGQEVHHLGGKKIPFIRVPFWLAVAAVPLFRLLAWLSGRTPLYTSESLHIIKNGNPTISSSLARNELNYQPRPFEGTVRDTVAWYRECGYI